MQQVIERDRLLDAVTALGAHLSRRLHEALDAHANVGDIRGRGLFMAVELVADRATKRPFDPALRLHARVKSEAMARGLLVYPMGGTIDGRTGDHVLLAPPFIATAAELDEIVARLRARDRRGARLGREIGTGLRAPRATAPAARTRCGISAPPPKKCFSICSASHLRARASARLRRFSLTSIVWWRSHARPRLLRHVLVDALAELAGVRRKIETFGFAAELHTMDHAGHDGVPYNGLR